MFSFYLAAWGLVRADYLLPYYDLTFAHTKPGDGYKRWMQSDNTMTSYSFLMKNTVL
jgi:hypothetical protein